MDDELIAFINARLDEDEARERKMLEMLANAGADACIALCFDDGTSSNAFDYNPWDVLADYDQDRALREIEAKRAIVRDYLDCAAAHSNGNGYPQVMRAARDAHGRDLLHLAAVWSDHPDYQQAWAL